MASKHDSTLNGTYKLKINSFRRAKKDVKELENSLIDAEDRVSAICELVKATKQLCEVDVSPFKAPVV